MRTNMTEAEMIAALSGATATLNADVPLIAGLQSTIDTLQAAVAALEAQIAAIPIGAYSQALVDAVTAVAAAAVAVHQQITSPPLPTPLPVQPALQ
jgi:hypothetical protein